MGYDKLTDRNIELACGKWQDEGFTIVFPETLAPNYINELISNNGKTTSIINTPSTMTISNKKVNVGEVYFVGVDKDENWITQFYPFEINKDGSANQAFYTFVDSKVNISGYIKDKVAICEFDEVKGADVFNVWKRITTYSVSWNMGWNVWRITRLSLIPSKTLTEEWKTIPSNNVKWYGGEDLWKLNIN